MIINLKKFNLKNLAIVDGGFDPLHDGHIKYFKLAKQACLKKFKIICCCASDKYIKKKHPVFLSEKKRLQVLDSIKYLDYVLLNNLTTAKILEIIKPKIYFKGVDWKGKLPKKEIEICKKYKIKIIYLNANLNSSTTLLKNFQKKNNEYKT